LDPIYRIEFHLFDYIIPFAVEAVSDPLFTYNATLSGKKLLAKIVNGVKQPTVFCPFERLVRNHGHLPDDLGVFKKSHT
jgi:hypothetical protein